MRNPSPSVAGTSTETEPVQLHYVKKIFINTSEATTALCGEPMVATSKTGGMGNGTSYTCPDCLIRYMSLPGGNNA